MFDFIPIPFQQNLKTSENTYQLSEVDIYWLTEATKKQLNGSRIKSFLKIGSLIFLFIEDISWISPLKNFFSVKTDNAFIPAF